MNLIKKDIIDETNTGLNYYSDSNNKFDKKCIRVCIDKFKTTDEINIGFMKLFTGGDSISTLCNCSSNIKSNDK